MCGLLFNMIFSTKLKIYQQVLLLYVCKKLLKLLFSAQPFIRINHLFYLYNFKKINLLINSGIGVRVQRTLQWRLSFNHNHLCMHPILVQTFCGKNLLILRDSIFEMSVRYHRKNPALMMFLPNKHAGNKFC